MTDKKKILICDDEVVIRESLKLILGEIYDLSFCTNGKECLDIITQGRSFNLILLDIKMPIANGLDTLRKIKKNNTQHKVIIVTGYRSFDTAQEAIKAGALDYIVKPFDSKNVLESVARNIK